MAEPESQTSRAEQRATAVAKLKRAASLPRMKDGRRPPMHSEGVSESENPIPTATPTPPLNGAEDKATPEPETAPSPPQEQHLNNGKSETKPNVASETRAVNEGGGQQQRGTEPETEGDGELEERSFSPGPSKRRRPRSRSRSRNSKDFKAKNRGAPSPSPIPHIAGDSSPDEAPPMPIALPIIPPLFTPVPSPFTLPQRYMASPDPSMFFAGPSSPPTPLPLPSLEALQKGLMRSNSARSTADSRRQAMAKLMGEPYDPSPSPPPLPVPGKGLTRNNTVAGGERIAARELMLGRLGARLAEVQQETDSDKEERAPTPSKRRKRRSRRGSASAALNEGTSDTASTNPPTPLPTAPNNFISATHLQLLRSLSATPNQALGFQHQNDERFMDYGVHADIDSEDPDHRHRGVLVESEDEDDGKLQQGAHPASRPRTPAATLSPHQPSPRLPAFRVVQNTDSPASHSSDSIPATNGKGSTVPLFLGRGSPARFDRFPSSPFTTPLKESQPPLTDDEDDEVVLRPRTPAVPDSRPRTPYANNRDAYDREISWVAYPGMYFLAFATTLH
jgi:serine/arginine repetitive matrix protein 2